MRLFSTPLPFIIAFSLLFSSVFAQRTPDPISPVVPTYASSFQPNPGNFLNIVFPSGGNIVASFFTSGRVTDGTGCAEYDDYVEGNTPGVNAYFIMNQSALRIATHIFSDNTDPFRHDVPNNTITQQKWEAEGGLSNPGWTYLFGRNELFPNAMFPQRSYINFKNYTIDQTVGAGTAQPIGISNVVVTIDGIMTFNNGKVYTLSELPSNLEKEEIVFLPSSTTSGGNSTSYFDGAMRKIGSASNFTYVLGDQGIYSPLTYTGNNPGANGTVARYYAVSGGNTSSLAIGMASISPEEHYAISSTDNSATLTIPTGNFPTYSGANLTIAGFNGTQWVNLKPGGGAGTISGGNVMVTGVNLTGITKIAPALSNSFFPLPVTFVSFTAIAEGKNAKLAWNIADAINVSHFEVERSCDGQRFSTAGSVSFSANRDHYSFTDAQPCAPLSYYRIKNVDLDGKIKYSPVRSVRFGNVDPTINIWPNPNSTQNLFASVPSSFSGGKAVHWALISHLGQQVKGGVTVNAYATQTFDISALATGPYTLVLLNADGNRLAVPFIKQ